jgi:hypothetical protein
MEIRDASAYYMDAIMRLKKKRMRRINLSSERNSKNVS